MNESAASADRAMPPPRSGCLTYILFGVACTWIVGVTFASQLAIWFTDQFTVYENTPPPWFAWLLATWAHGLLLAVPLGLLAVFTRAPRFRVVYRTWMLAVALVFALGLARVFPTVESQAAALTQIAVSLIASAWLVRFARRGLDARLTRDAAAWRFGLALAPLVMIPSLLWGALGSPLDTLLDFLAALSLGLFVGLLLDLFLFRPLAAMQPLSAGREIVYTGFVVSVTLVILAGGFGVGGSQLLLLVALPPLGFALAALNRLARAHDAHGAWLPIAALVGLAAAAPLMFFDPDELSIFLGGEIIRWAFGAVGVSWLLAWGIGFVLWLLRHRLRAPPRARLSLGLLALTWLGVLAVYIFAGLPGFYGEQLFVILREQADVRAAYKIADRSERLRFVYTMLTTHADRTQGNLRATLDRLGIAYHPYYLVNALEVNGGPLLRAYLSAQPEVERILDSPHLRPLPAPPSVSTGDQPQPSEPQWNITLIGADRVWNELGVTGRGIVVGQSDSGVQGDHPALRDGYRGRGGQNDYNWLDPWNHTRAPADSGGHGTHTLGSILGSGGIGVAPDAQWIGCVNLARNLGNPPLYLNCMQFMLAPYPQQGDPLADGDPTKAAHVLNNSWGCPPVEGCDANALAPAVSALRAAGIFVVVSAGNEGPRCNSVDSPLALYGDVFSVGAVDRGGTLAVFSSRGPVTADGSHRVKPDIVAPGVDVLSAFPGNTYAVESGTSMAGPHVAGVVALMWSAQPKLIGNVERTAQILTRTAKPYASAAGPGCFDAQVPSDAYGYGVVDAYAAVQMAQQEK